MNTNRPWIAAALLGIGCFALAATRESPAGIPFPTRNCLPPAAWMALDGEGPHIASAGAVLAAMAKREVVLLGENHDDEDHHRWQLQALAALHAQRPDMVVGFEMFPRRVQPVLDRWVAGELSVRQLLEQTEWDKVWHQPADLYLPLFQFARINRIPMLALNVERKLSRAIAEKGWDAIPEAEREGVGRAAPASEAYRDYLLAVYRQHAARHGKTTAKAEKNKRPFRYFVESQTAWDRAMAEALARRLPAGGSGEAPLLVGIMGSGHLRFGHGVPRQLRDLGVARIGTLIPLAVDADCQDLRAGLADAVFALPKAALEKADPPRLGMRLEQGKDGVRIAEVVSGSPAESSGVKAGDHLLEVAGLPAKNALPAAAEIRQQSEGSSLPVLVKRGGETLEIMIRIPARP